MIGVSISGFVQGVKVAEGTFLLNVVCSDPEVDFRDQIHFSLNNHARIIEGVYKASSISIILTSELSSLYPQSSASELDMCQRGFSATSCKRRA